MFDFWFASISVVILYILVFISFIIIRVLVEGKNAWREPVFAANHTYFLKCVKTQVEDLKDMNCTKMLMLSVFWDVMLCNVVESWLHFQSRRVSCAWKQGCLCKESKKLNQNGRHYPLKLWNQTWEREFSLLLLLLLFVRIFGDSVIGH